MNDRLRDPVDRRTILDSISQIIRKLRIHVDCLSKADRCIPSQGSVNRFENIQDNTCYSLVLVLVVVVTVVAVVAVVEDVLIVVATNILVFTISQVSIRKYSHS